jgi:hypothetical protein
MKVKYVNNRSFLGLEREVNELAAKGWQLHGDLVYLNAAYVQAMTKVNG